MLKIVDDDCRMFVVMDKQFGFITFNFNPHFGPSPGDEVDISFIMARHFGAEAIKLPIGIGKILGGAIAAKLLFGSAIGWPQLHTLKS